MRTVLLRAVRRHCPAELRSQTEDLAHTAWLRIVEREAGENLTRLEPSYLWRVAFTVVIDEIRRRSARVAQAETLQAGPRAVAPGPELGEEVARALQFNEKRAQNLIYRGLEQLRRCLAAKGIEEP